MARILKHRAILRGGAKVHLARATLTPRRPKTLHSHDFFELFWVQNGTVRHHGPDGTEALDEGALVFVRPKQEHGLQGRGEQALVVSLTIHPKVIAGLAERHPALKGQLFWGSSSAPEKRTRNMRQLAELNHAALQLEKGARDTLGAEAFLLPLCAELAANTGRYPSGAPDWLTTACTAAQDQAVFHDGAAGLVALTGRAHPHVSRTMRRYFGQTPSDYVNNIRMTYAARALITDVESISQIAADCGIPNMSHFHKLFRTAHGLTPLQYRQKFQRNVVQPT